MEVGKGPSCVSEAVAWNFQSDAIGYSAGAVVQRHGKTAKCVVDYLTFESSSLGYV